MNRITRYEHSDFVIDFYEDYLVLTTNEGSHISTEHEIPFWYNVNKHFGNKKFVCIGNRVNSFSINPIIYLNEKSKNLIGLAVVSKKESIKPQVKLEQMFYKKPIVFFTKMEEAIQWKNKMLMNEKIKKV